MRLYFDAYHGNSWELDIINLNIKHLMEIKYVIEV